MPRKPAPPPQLLGLLAACGGGEQVSAVAHQLGVSRIPVMRACHRLVGEGFLLANPRRSLTVVAQTEARMVETVEVLLALTERVELSRKDRESLRGIVDRLLGKEAQ